MALKSGFDSIAMLLVLKGADVNRPNDRGETAMSLAPHLDVKFRGMLRYPYQFQCIAAFARKQKPVVAAPMQHVQGVQPYRPPGDPMTPPPQAPVAFPQVLKGK